ncbi:hypothetical protein GQX73_g8705 [Xylaria multiplex]|uniref:Zn(2)-C6 fungal-type domain-containing protein n=1 Tax=Xylaria multiplex TaxID=323545 RepID=A0A7C8MKG5_9PEZI|nr:hypothetical protein GQX73_g8705 [Xylaria multiplex]
MNPEDQSLAAAKALGGRVSVACLPCRNRHVRCDAQQPICIRCSSEGRTCQYVKSRRGGLNRARLAERRRARNGDGAVAGSPSDASAESRSPGQAVGQDYRATGGNSSTLSQEPSARASESETSDLEGECHPCALPQQKLQQYYEKTPEQGSLALLVAVMRFIGSLYSFPDLTPQLQDKVTEGFQAARKLAPDPFLAQCHLLYSISLYWSTEKVKAREEIDTAIGIALNLGMNHCQFASEHGRGDAVLEESFRRTWWQLFCIDAYYAAIKRLPTFSLCEVNTDTDLPCEEDEYESGSIPTPKTLEDFDTREFGPENQSFSSFAYLIGATRSIALALSAGAPDASNWLSPKTIAEVDAIIDGWFLLLPKSKREVLKEDNVVDELMFQAQMAVHANLIALHRPFSKLPFHPLEGVSSCLVEPPKRLPVKDSEAAHTQRCLQSIEAQLQLLVLPAQPCRRSPFTVCMTAACSHTLLAAIKVHFSGRQLAVARHQLRLVVGYIRALAKVWPQGVKNLDEIQIIAQEILSRKNESPRRTATPEKVNVNSQKPSVVDGAPCIEGLDNWINPAITLENPDSLSSYWNFSNDFQPDIPIWFSSY